MATKAKAQAEPRKNGKERSPLLDGARRVLLASIGAAALAQDEIDDFVNRLVERGEIAEKDARKLLGELREKRMKRMGISEEQVNERVGQLFERLNLPSKTDIAALNEKIAALSKKVDELKKKQG